jgi:hypothetical protein
MTFPSMPVLQPSESRARFPTVTERKAPAMLDPNTATIPSLADQEPADPGRREEIRTLAGIVASALAMVPPDIRLAQHTRAIEDALADGGQPDDPMRIVMLMVPLINAECRAAACAQVGVGAEARPHLDLWLWIARHTLGAPPECLPLTVAGFAAARAGFTPLALDCFDRATAKPGLADARTYRDALAQQVPGDHLRPHFPQR